MSGSLVRLPDRLQRSGAPLQEGDRADRTVGCRQTQPKCCGRNSLPSVCAFSRPDGICLAPPTSWKKQFAALSRQAKAPR
jgi:hypothetical protein